MEERVIFNSETGAADRKALFSRFKSALDTLTIESSRRSHLERVEAIEFLSSGRSSSDILMIFSGVLRRFRLHLDSDEKVKIADVLAKHRNAPPLLRQSVSSTLMKALEIESTPAVQNAYRDAVYALNSEE